LENDKKEDENIGKETNGLTQEQITALEEAAGTFPIFNPILSAFPVPNDLMVDRTTEVDGTYVSSPLLSALDYLDGAATSASYDIKTSAPLTSSSVDSRSFIPHPDGSGLLIPNPTQNVFLLDLTYPGSDELISTTGVDINGDGEADLTEVPTFQAGILYSTYTATIAAVGGDLNHVAVLAAKQALEVNVNFRANVVIQDGEESIIRISPRTPLNPESKYLVVVTNEVKDDQGKNIKASPSYTALAGTDTLLSEALQPVRNAIGGWEQLAAGWFGAATNGSRAAFGGAPAGLPDLDSSNIALSLTFTTGGTDTVLNAMAAPETFFTKSATIVAKKEGITALFNGEIAFPGSAITDTRDAFFQGLVTTTTAPTYIAKVADGTYTSYLALLTAVGAEAADVSSTDLFKAQAAAATANLSSVNGDSGPGAGDGTTIALTSTGTTDALVGAGFMSKPTSGVTDKLDLSGSGLPGVTFHDTFIPIAETSTGTLADYRLPSAGLLGVTASPGYIMQGQIDLPYYLPSAEAPADAGNILTGTWVANEILVAANPALAAPSSKVTYRFPFAQKTGTETVPFILSTPDEASVTKPANGWPVVIFQHGIFGQRGDGLPLANALGAACLSGGVNPGNAEVVNLAGQDAPRCFATISIDMPLHGVAPTRLGGTLDALALGGLSVDVAGAADGFAARDWSATHYAGLHERHYNWSKSSTGTPTPMIYDTDISDAIGNAGEFYINLGLPPASRDNLRQSALDLVSLTASLADIDLDGTANKDVDGNIVDRDLDTDRVYLLGHSLGGIVGTTFAATNNNLDVQAANPTLPDLKAVAFETSGGQIIRILENSDFLSTPILAGLASFGLQPQSTSYETFMNIAQASIESADSINFAAKLHATGTPILATEVYGDGILESTQDQIIPPAADSVDSDYLAPKGTALDAPLAGTEPFIQELGLTNITTAGFYEPGGAVQSAVRKNSGGHTTVSTADPLTAFTEIATEYVTFFSGQGQEVAVGAAVNPVDGTPTATVISTAEPDISN
jgi:pimeloyl-ACP methyl ester carboxylesterase